MPDNEHNEDNKVTENINNLNSDENERNAPTDAPTGEFPHELNESTVNTLGGNQQVHVGGTDQHTDAELTEATDPFFGGEGNAATDAAQHDDVTYDKINGNDRGTQAGQSPSGLYDEDAERSEAFGQNDGYARVDPDAQHTLQPLGNQRATELDNLQQLASKIDITKAQVIINENRSGPDADVTGPDGILFTIDYGGAGDRTADIANDLLACGFTKDQISFLGNSIKTKPLGW